MVINILKLLLSLTALIVISVLAYIGLQTYNRALDLQAINDCTTSYRQEIVEASDSATQKIISRPLEQQARECTTQKGVENWDGVWSDLVN